MQSLEYVGNGKFIVGPKVIQDAIKYLDVDFNDKQIEFIILKLFEDSYNMEEKIRLSKNVCYF